MKFRHLPAAASLVLGAASAFGSGCQSIIGIEDRTFDESLATGGKGGATSNAGGKSAGGLDAAGGTDAGATGEGGSAGGPPENPCVEYCELVEQNCKNECPPSNPACPDDLRVYSSPTICMNVCAELEVGDLEAANPRGNTLACRLQQARFAGTISDEAWAHCPAAGPGGAGICGDNCESYCQMMDDFCAADFPEYIDPECVDKCRGLRDAGLDANPSATASIYGADLHHDGDFLQCRIVHVSSASEAPLQHCWHAALAPKPLATALNPCADQRGVVPRCVDYCRLVMVSCPSEFAVYDDEAQCVKACAAMDPGDAVDDTGSNTVGCRRNHAYNALIGGQDLHCPHAGPGGNGVCGTNCDSYCTLLAEACEDDFTTMDECVAECEDLPGAASGSSYAVESVEDGKSFQCRLRAVVRAFQEPDECANALGGGDCAD